MCDVGHEPVVLPRQVGLRFHEVHDARRADQRDRRERRRHDRARRRHAAQRIPDRLRADRQPHDDVEQEVAGEARLHVEPSDDEREVRAEHRHSDVREQGAFAVAPQPNARDRRQPDDHHERADLVREAMRVRRQRGADRRGREVVVGTGHHRDDREARAVLLVGVVDDVAQHRRVEHE